MDMLIGIHSWKKNMPPEVEDIKLNIVDKTQFFWYQHPVNDTS